MEIITTNVAGLPRRVKRPNGREYLVARGTLLVPGTLHGSRGKVYYPPDEVRKDPGVWNDAPMVVYHPKRNGRPVPAKDPHVLDYTKVGRVYNASAPHALGAELWFDVETTRRVDPRVLTSLEAGDPIEVSTGLYTTNEPAPPGSKDEKGRPYDFVARDYRPDHLAILPDRVGACSIKDGCGVLVNEMERLGVAPNYWDGGPTTDGPPGDDTSRLNVMQRLAHLLGLGANEPTHDDVRTQLSQLLRARFPPRASRGGGGAAVDPDGPWVVDVYDSTFVYHREGKLWQLGYKTDNKADKVTLAEGEPEQVRRVTQYKAVSNEEPPPSADDPLPPTEGTMTDVQKTALINSLVANCGCQDRPRAWRGKTAAELAALPDDTLVGYMLELSPNTQPAPAAAPPANNTLDETRLATVVATAVAAAMRSVPTAQPVTAPPPAPAGSGAATTPQTANQVALEAWMNDPKVPQEAKRAVQFGMQMEAQEKTSLIERVTANLAEGEGKTQAVAVYNAMDITQLRTIAASFPDRQAAPTTPANPFSFVGAQGAPPAAHTVNEEPLLCHRPEFKPRHVNGRALTARDAG